MIYPTSNILVKRNASAGFTLVEVLVGLLIGLIGTIVIFQVFAVSEGQKRTATAGGDAQQNGTFALYSMEQDIRNAGSGLGRLDQSLLRCNVLAYNSTVSTTIFNFRLIPLMITDGGGTASDSITVLYGTSALNSIPAIFDGVATAGADWQVNSNQGFQVQDLILAVESPPLTASCTLAQVSALSLGKVISHNSGTTTPYNKSGGLGVGYSASGQVINLGTPVISNYFISAAGELRSHPVLQDVSTALDVPIVNGIFNMQAQYGIDANDDNIIDSWVEPTGTWAATALTAAKVSQIKAVRLAIITRSAQQEKTNVTTTDITIFSDNAAGAAAVSVVIPITGTNQRFRYQTFETVIPIRNVIWNFSS